MINKNSIFNFKYLGIIFFALVIILLALVVTLLKNSQQSYNDLVQQSLHKELAKNMLMESKDLMHGIIDKKSLGETFHAQMLLGPAFDIYVVSTSGKLMAWSNKDAEIKRNKIKIDSIFNYIKGSKFPIYGTNPREKEGEQIFSVSEIKDALGKTKAYLYVIIGGNKQSFFQNIFFQKYIFSHAYIILISSILAITLLICILYFSILNPIYHVSNQLKKMDSEFIVDNIGIKNIILNKFSISEIKTLIDNINKLLSKIKDQMNEIKNRDDSRKKFLSYLAHDIKTPLASMQGYVETWLILNPNAKNSEYLEIALRNSRTINKFTEQILELSNIESNLEIVKNEKIDIKNFSKNLFDKFYIKTKSKQIDFSVELPDKIIYIYADIHKFERILSNLIENSIRHTRPGGIITLRISNIEKEILFEVIDSGEGIDPSDLPFIFQSRYSIKAKQNGDYNQQQHGLGLAIVKSLLDLYEINIFVKSVVGKGSTFSFKFPLID